MNLVYKSNVFYILIFLLTCSSVRCKPIYPATNPEIIYSIMAMADYEKKEFLLQPHSRRQRILIRDSSVIEECTHIRELDSLGIITFTVSVKFYTFIDLTTKTFYRYRNFF